jgi:hypothetical protein
MELMDWAGLPQIELAFSAIYFACTSDGYGDGLPKRGVYDGTRSPYSAT